MACSRDYFIQDNLLNIIRNSEHLWHLSQDLSPLLPSPPSLHVMAVPFWVVLSRRWGLPLSPRLEFYPRRVRSPVTLLPLFILIAPTHRLPTLTIGQDSQCSISLLAEWKLHARRDKLGYLYPSLLPGPVRVQVSVQQKQGAVSTPSSRESTSAEVLSPQGEGRIIL